MSTSVGMKSKKKQPASLTESHRATENRDLEQSLLRLENSCHSILEQAQAADPQDTESRYWHQRFENLTTPVSLALAECKGPRRFHYHYRRRADDESILHPVMDNPLDMLAHVCEEALHHCQDDMPGMHDRATSHLRRELEASLQGFLASYRHSKK